MLDGPTHCGSRFSPVRWVQQQAVSEVLGLEAFVEEDLYAGWMVSAVGDSLSASVKSSFPT